jgi:hypothetical protein
MKCFLALCFGLFLFSGCVPARPPSSTEVLDTTQPGAGKPAPALISAFFGLDHALPTSSNQICNNAKGQNGMPVVFPLELEMTSLQAGDFQIVTQSGQLKSVYCVTPAPALDPGEFRTLLLIGDYGTKNDQPVRVNVVGGLLDSTSQFNFKGQSVSVTPLEAGPTLVLAHLATKAEWSRKATRATSCPSQSVQVVRVTWAGGVTRPDGAPVGEAERLAYQVTLESANGSRRVITPFALADLSDNDNNHDLCLDVSDQVTRVWFKAGLLVDPAGDFNPATEIQITPNLVYQTR